MDTINYKGKTYIGPASWQECKPAMIANLIGFSRIPKTEITLQVKEMAVQILFSISEQDWKRWMITGQEWKMLCDLIEWVFTAPSGRPFPSFKHDGITYILPLENFADTTALELSLAFMAFTDFADPEEPDLDAINRLIATICRPVRPDLENFKRSADWNGDERETFNEARMMFRAKSLSSMNLAEKTVLLSYFEVQAKMFLEQYESLFGGETAPRYGDGRGWIMLLKNIAKEGHFGNFDQVCKQYVHLVYAAALDDSITAQEAQYKQDNDYGS